MTVILADRWGPSKQDSRSSDRRYQLPGLGVAQTLERRACGSIRASDGPPRRHSRDMVAHRYFSHTSRSGPSSSGRIGRTGWMRGPRRWTVGENLAWHKEPAGARWVVRAWLRSPEHRHVLLNRGYRVAGIGVSRGTPLATPGATFTADFGS